ncbi:MAG TPA: glycosyltransferase family 39 protein, partial [Thermoanaerobaculia bacterium]|nr:glycosyltransferase family 39 protein [Thermoanaerobaculia bacterium]
MSPKADAAARLLLVVLVGAGVALRAVNFLALPSLTLDEAALALSIVGRPVSSFLSPLEGGQVAPWGFLVLEKGLFLVVGRSDWGLRLLPLAASIASCVLVCRLARRMLEGVAVPFATGAFALSPGFIFYGGQMKQYATEVAASLLMTLLASRSRGEGLTPRRAAALGAWGLGLALLSQSVVFVLTGLFLSLAVLAWRKRERTAALALLVLAAFWGAGITWALFTNLRLLTPAGRAYVR